jgi:hypothetical protein
MIGCGLNRHTIDLNRREIQYNDYYFVLDQKQKDLKLKFIFIYL